MPTIQNSVFRLGQSVFFHLSYVSFQLRQEVLTLLQLKLTREDQILWHFEFVRE